MAMFRMSAKLWLLASGGRSRHFASADCPGQHGKNGVAINGFRYWHLQELISGLFTDEQIPYCIVPVNQQRFDHIRIIPVFWISRQANSG
ncbi:hypothetical protein SAMN02744775_00007 [Enterobacter sp. CC120223-11]|nr:hypothetical protein SAMN02744775_00007 [Enterobacter sp. CC120223-11]